MRIQLSSCFPWSKRPQAAASPESASGSKSMSAVTTVTPPSRATTYVNETDMSEFLQTKNRDNSFNTMSTSTTAVTSIDGKRVDESALMQVLRTGFPAKTFNVRMQNDCYLVSAPRRLTNALGRAGKDITLVTSHDPTLTAHHAHSHRRAARRAGLTDSPAHTQNTTCRRRPLNSHFFLLICLTFLAFFGLAIGVWCQVARGGGRLFWNTLRPPSFGLRGWGDTIGVGCMNDAWC
ncbi:hypothetical protein B0T22DRAFT_312789 [Podospora appendiculata]|uniref:Uncharacterized protein n=1 Tax=Podospora appendiculata TaxID=314037 RepID=A0AAE0WYX9_9PEZI|nr:hypothetical protein B0T22DRAFT_312789 [Podospora appendiculata]